jgi:hypothetical protein
MDGYMDMDQVAQQLFTAQIGGYRDQVDTLVS